EYTSSRRGRVGLPRARRSGAAVRFVALSQARLMRSRSGRPSSIVVNERSRPNQSEPDATRDATACSDDIRVSASAAMRSEEHTSELQSRGHLVCRLLLEKKKEIY